MDTADNWLIADMMKRAVAVGAIFLAVAMAVGPGGATDQADCRHHAVGPAGHRLAQRPQFHSFQE